VKYFIITNNSIVKETIHSYYQNNVLFFCDIDDIFLTTRNKIHQNYKLITSALSSSLKPYQNPFKTILIQQSSSLCDQSLKYIESALQRYDSFKNNKKNINDIDKNILHDFALIDFSLVQKALKENNFIN